MAADRFGTARAFVAGSLATLAGDRTLAGGHTLAVPVTKDFLRFPPVDCFLATLDLGSALAAVSWESFSSPCAASPVDSSSRRLRSKRGTMAGRRGTSSARDSRELIRLSLISTMPPEAN